MPYTVEHMTIPQALTHEGIHYNGLQNGNYSTTCPRCSHQRRKKKETCLSVNINEEGAVWNCHHCNWTGNFLVRQRPTSSTKIAYYKDKNYSTETVYKKPISLVTPLKVEQFAKFWKERKISEDTVQHFGIREIKKTFHDGEKWCLAFPYKYNEEVVNYKYRTKDKDFRQEANARRTLFNIDTIKDEKEIIIVEGEMDVLALYECGITNVISLPDGAPQEAKFREDDKRFDALKESAEILSQAKKVTIAGDMDKQGQALAQELAHRFGKDRCYLVDWVDWKDANEALIGLGKEYVLQCLSSAKAYPVDGLYKVEDYESQLFDLYEGKEERPLSTGYSVLDSIYKLMTGTFTVITGIPNHGKSNFLDQILMNASKLHNWKFAVFSPEHSTPRHLTRLAEKYCEKPFNEGLSPRMTTQELKEAIKHLNEHFFFLESREERPTIDWVLEKARIACIRNRLQGIVIDPYNEVDTSNRGSKREDEYIRDIIAQCKRFARTHEVCVWVVAHPAKMHRQNDGSYPIPSMYDISGSAHWHNMADIGLCIHRNFEDDTTSIFTKKIREQGLYGDIGEALFTFDLVRRVYYQKEQISEPSKYWND